MSFWTNYAALFLEKKMCGGETEKKLQLSLDVS